MCSNNKFPIWVEVTLAGYAACIRHLSALPPRPSRPDKWGRFGLSAFLNAGKNGDAFHRLDNDLAANLAGFCAGGLKSENRYRGTAWYSKTAFDHWP